MGENLLENIFYENIAQILNLARENAKTAVNITMVYAYYEIGRTIVEEEQNGKTRAEYGKRMLQGLSEYLTKKIGKGFSVGNLKNIRQFYKTYVADQIGETVFSQFENLPSVGTGRKFVLSWSHYRALLQVADSTDRSWYEKVAYQQTWSVRTLQRNINTQYYYHILQFQRKDLVEQEMLEKTSSFQNDKLEFVQNPVIAEFLGLSSNIDFTETDLETSII